MMILWVWTVSSAASPQRPDISTIEEKLMDHPDILGAGIPDSLIRQFLDRDIHNQNN